MDYNKLNAKELSDIVAAEHPDAWAAAAKAWGKTAVLANNAQADISSASGEINLWRQSGDSEAQAAFDQRINDDLKVLHRWGNFGFILSLRLQTVASVLAAAQPVMRAWADERADQDRIRDAAADDVGARNTASNRIDDLDDMARDRMKLIVLVMNDSMTDKDPERPGRWTGPRAAPGGATDPDAVEPRNQSQGPGTGVNDGTGGGSAPGDANPSTPADPATPKAPEAKDPWDEAGKIIDVIGKGIDLTGKVPENLDKWLTLAQHAKDLGGGDTSTATTPDLSSVTPHGPLSDEPALAGGVSTTPPTFTPTHFTPTTGSGSGGGGLPSIGVPLGGGIGAGHTNLPTSSTGTSDRGASSLRSATTAGEAGAEPSLSGKTATSPTAGTQSSSSPMYPPMGGAGGAGAGAAARSEIRPGAAPSKSGFTVPTESTAAERMRRQGVQSDLQGRTNGERRTPSGAPPLRKRSRSARVRRTGGDEVLDEELWKP